MDNSGKNNRESENILRQVSIMAECSALRRNQEVAMEENALGTMRAQFEKAKKEFNKFAARYHTIYDAVVHEVDVGTGKLKLQYNRVGDTYVDRGLLANGVLWTTPDALLKRTSDWFFMQELPAAKLRKDSKYSYRHSKAYLKQVADYKKLGYWTDSKGKKQTSPRRSWEWGKSQWLGMLANVRYDWYSENPDALDRWFTNIQRTVCNDKTISVVVDWSGRKNVPLITERDYRNYREFCEQLGMEENEKV